MTNSKPRTVTSVEDLDELPLETVIRTSSRRIYEKGCFIGEEGVPFWVPIGERVALGSPVIPLPATVLWEPSE